MCLAVVFMSDVMLSSMQKYIQSYIAPGIMLFVCCSRVRDKHVEMTGVTKFLISQMKLNNSRVL